MAEVVSGPWVSLNVTDQQWQAVIDTALAAYTALRQQGIPEPEAVELVLAGLLDTIRTTHNI